NGTSPSRGSQALSIKEEPHEVRNDHGSNGSQRVRRGDALCGAGPDRQEHDRDGEARGGSLGSPRRKGNRSRAPARGRGRLRRDDGARYTAGTRPGGAYVRAPRPGVATDVGSRGRAMDRAPRRSPRSDGPNERAHIVVQRPMKTHGPDDTAWRRHAVEGAV